MKYFKYCLGKAFGLGTVWVMVGALSMSRVTSRSGGVTAMFFFGLSFVKKACMGTFLSVTNFVHKNDFLVANIFKQTRGALVVKMPSSANLDLPNLLF
jgi:hypothetical protein